MDVYDYRRSALKAWADDLGGPAALAKAVGRSDSQISQLLGEKQMGAKLARALEEALKAEPGSFDRPIWMSLEGGPIEFSLGEPEDYSANPAKAALHPDDPRVVNKLSKGHKALNKAVRAMAGQLTEEQARVIANLIYMYVGQNTVDVEEPSIQK